MYGKIFEDIFKSSLIAEGGWLPTYIFMSMVALADKDGFFRDDPRNFYEELKLHRENGVPFDEFREALEFLEKPDDLSNLDTLGGRRIVSLCTLPKIEGNRGWVIVNYQHYRDKGGSLELKRQKDAERQQRKRDRDKSSRDDHVASCDGHVKSQHTDTDTDTDKTEHTSSADAAESAKTVSCPHQKIVDLYHKNCPDLPRVRTWEGNRKQNLRQRFMVRDNLDWWEWFFQVIHTLDFHNGRTEGKTWRANLDWIVKHSNFQKLLDICYERTEAQ